MGRAGQRDIGAEALASSAAEEEQAAVIGWVLAMTGHDVVGQVVQGALAGSGGEGGRQPGDAHVEGLAPTLHDAVAIEGQHLTGAQDKLVFGHSGRCGRRSTERGR